MIQTISLCPICYLTIPATIDFSGGLAVMSKTCPGHGEFNSVVESEEYYKWCLSHPSGIYPSHLIDVTNNCDMSCKYCYHDKTGGDIPLDYILNEARTTIGPYVLIGGEPTTRQDLPKIIAKISEIGDMALVTNGSGFTDPKYLDECLEYLPLHKGHHAIGLSYHPNQGKFEEIIFNLKFAGVRPETIFWVIDNVEQIPAIIDFSEKHKGMFGDIRIKAASNLWDCEGTNKILVSDMLEWFFENRPGAKMHDRGKSVFLPVWDNGIPYLLISWHDVGNVDLLDISCPPTYRAKSGQVMNFVSAALVNEGMKKGWLHGKPYHQ